MYFIGPVPSQITARCRVLLPLQATSVPHVPLVFPPQNLVSPVADELREKLAGVNWARAGLGLPLVSKKNYTIICLIKKKGL